MTQEEYKDEVRRIRPKLLSVAHRYVGANDAEDTVQDVLLRLWQMLDELRLPIDALATVLVRNRCISLLRKQRPSVPLPAVSAPGGFPTASAPGGFPAASAPGGFHAASTPGGFPAASVPGGFPAGVSSSSAADRLDRLMAIIETLPTLQQTVLRLRHVDGMEMRDIAAIVGSSEVAVRKTLSRARQAVRQKFQKQDDR